MCDHIRVGHRDASAQKSKEKLTHTKKSMHIVAINTDPVLHVYLRIDPSCFPAPQGFQGLGGN